MARSHGIQAQEKIDSEKIRSIELSLTSKKMILDVFRGLAALMMIYNHAGYAWLPADATLSGPTGDCLFVTSMAPVLFFFATGVGMGWAARSQPLTVGVWRKAGLLFVADMFLNWGNGRLIGLDFFGFIGIATIAVGLMRSTRQPVVCASSSILLLFALRYLPLAAWKEAAQRLPLLAFVTGAWPANGVSYPLSPWLIYPLLGFVLAWTRSSWCSLRWISPWMCLAAVTLIVTGLSACLAQAGAGFFRWGTMSLNYFIASIAILGVSWAVACASMRVHWIATALALRGASSLLVVPLHYALIYSVKALLVRPVTSSLWFFGASGLAVVAITLSRGLSARGAARPVTTGTLLTLLTVTAATTLASVILGAPAMLIFYMACIGQVLVAWNLAREVVPVGVGTSEIAEPRSKLLLTDRQECARARNTI